MQLNERMAQTAHSARKRKECPTAVEQRCNRSRHMESTQTTPEVQASWETYPQRTIVNQPHRPVTTSGWIQHQGQPRDRILIAHGKGSTGYSKNVLDAGKMAVSLQKVPATASLMTTSREEKETEEKDESRSLYHKQGGSGGIGGVG